MLLNTSATLAGTPTFSGPFNFAAGPNPAAVAVAPLSGTYYTSGLFDIVVANGGSATGMNGISVLQNTTPADAASPSFALPVGLDSGGANPASVAVPDVNGDGRLDIVVANGGSASGTNGASAFLNTTPAMSSALSFTGPDNFDTGSHPAAVINSSLETRVPSTTATC